MIPDTPSREVREATNFLRQERRFFRDQLQQRAFASRQFSSAPTTDEELDQELESKQLRIIHDSALQNELGLYRNASLTLACIQIARSNFDSALNYLLDVAFLDMSGAINSVPGNKSFDRQLADLLPFIANIIRGTAKLADLEVVALEGAFKSRWESFSSFGRPPYSADTTWRKLKKATEA